jgi:hypothetical protein
MLMSLGILYYMCVWLEIKLILLGLSISYNMGMFLELKDLKG